MSVKLVATVKLLVSPEERERLLATMRRVNEACSWLAERAFELQSADKLRLQKLYYQDLRARFGLSSQHAVRTISKVCEVYKRDKSRLCRFRPTGAIAYDQRLYTFKNGLDRVSLLALDGRLVVPCAVGAYHRGRLEGVRGQADLVYRKGALYLFVTVEVPDGSPIDPEGWLGVDLGIRNLAVDSDGEPHSGEKTLALRSRIATLRASLQSRGTKSAKRHLRALRRRERCFHAHTNHVISKSIVHKAKDTGRGIAVEDLSGIRDRVTVRKAQRATLHSWSFFRLRGFLTYKALLSGVALVAVDPRNTSRTCPECGNIDKANRRSQAEFVCTGCGFAAHADWVGARNIASRAVVDRPIGSAVRLGIEHFRSSPQLCQVQSSAL
jgi:putative transposase